MWERDGNTHPLFTLLLLLFRDYFIVGISGIGRSFGLFSNNGNGVVYHLLGS